MPDLLVKNISASYHLEIREKWNIISKKRSAFESVSFSVPHGKRLAIIGETGSGKSSLLKSVCGFLPIESGEIVWNKKRIDSISLAEWKPIRKEIQIVQQNPLTAFNPAISIKNSLFNVLNSHFSFSDNEKIELIRSEMKKIQLSNDLFEKQPHQLSGGQLQRFSILRSFLLNPQLILCDEPLSALDFENQTQVMNYLTEKSVQINCSVIWVTHQLTFIGGFCDQIMVLKDGKCQDYGSFSEVTANPKSEYTKTILKTVH